MPTHSTTPDAYSYIRFSFPEQAKGDSVRRQMEAAAQWCDRNGIHLDTLTTLHDLGRSAYTGAHRRNPDRNALAAFLQLIERGKVRRGSHLIIENLDRLSREEEVPACHLLTSILMAGVKVVQLSPAELVLTEKSSGWDIMRAVMELSRGHGESALKSERVGKAWRQKKQRARESGEVMTHRLPAWVEERDGKLHLIPERAAVVRLIFELSIAGYGMPRIIRKLNEDRVPAFGGWSLKKSKRITDRWNTAYIDVILTDRRAVGEFQPRLKDGTPDGPPITGYYPAVVSEETWQRSRGARSQRRKSPGRVGTKLVNPFSGLLHDARDGGAYYVSTYGPKRAEGGILLINRSGIEGRSRLRSFPYSVFEAAVLGLLRELDPRELLEGANGHDKVMQLEGESGQLEQDIATISAELDRHGESPTLYARLRAKEQRYREVQEELARARQEAANPLSAAWGEAQSLAAVVEGAEDKEDVRTRLRAALRRIVESVYLLIVPRKGLRLVAVQVFFTGGGRRDYLIAYRRATGGSTGTRPSSWWARSLADAAGQCDFDLRKPEHAEDLEAALMELPLS
jgi:DNA invertase Pin-like site-specific DNA recombinase